MNKKESQKNTVTQQEENETVSKPEDRYQNIIKIKTRIIARDTIHTQISIPLEY